MRRSGTESIASPCVSANDAPGVGDAALICLSQCAGEHVRSGAPGEHAHLPCRPAR
jgi:hypothetical protein